MTTRSLFTEQLVAALSHNQSSLSDIEARRQFHQASSDVSFVSALVKALMNSETQWKSICDSLERLLATATEQERKLIEEGVLETISDVLDSEEYLAVRVIPYLGDLAREYFEFYENWHSPKPLAASYPKMGTEVRKEDTEEFVKAVCLGQKVLDADSLQAMREEAYELPDGFLIREIVMKLVANADQVDWRKFLETVEGFLERKPSEELEANIYLYVFEMLSVSATSKDFSYQWIVNHIGPNGRAMLTAIESQITSPLIFAEFVKPKLV